MKPTNITIYHIPNPKSKVLAYVEIEFDELLIVKNFKIINGMNGLFLAMPSSKGTDEKFHDNVFINKSHEEETPGREFRNRLQAVVLKKFQENNTKPDFEDQSEKKPNQFDDLPF